MKKYVVFLYIIFNLFKLFSSIEEDFLVAVASGNIQEVKRLINSRVDINTRDKDGQTPLILATYKGYKEIVIILIKNGANVNIKDKNGWTALTYALAKKHNEIVFLLKARELNKKE